MEKPSFKEVYEIKNKVVLFFVILVMFFTLLSCNYEGDYTVVVINGTSGTIDVEVGFYGDYVYNGNRYKRGILLQGESLSITNYDGPTDGRSFDKSPSECYIISYSGVYIVYPSGASINSDFTVFDIESGVTTYTIVDFPPYPLKNNVWFTFDSSTYSIVPSYSGYVYYSFPVRGGTYKIQFANEAKTGNVSSYVRVSAYWSADNSRKNLITSYFTDATYAFTVLPHIIVSQSGYVILKIYAPKDYSTYYHSVRFWKAE